MNSCLLCIPVPSGKYCVLRPTKEGPPAVDAQGFKGNWEVPGTFLGKGGKAVPGGFQEKMGTGRLDRAMRREVKAELLEDFRKESHRFFL